MRRFFGLNFRSGLLIGCAIAIAVAAAAITYERYDTKTLKRTRNRDAVLCGVNPGLPGFASADEKGNWRGFDVDFCRAIAAAIFDDPGKVKFVPLDAGERFTELQKRKIDVLSRNSTWNMARETGYGLHFAAVSYYDGQGFMVHRSRNVDSSLELDQARVCVQADTTTQAHLAGYFGSNNVKYQEKKFAKQEDVLKAYASDQCDVLTADVSQLYSLRLKLANPGEHVILPDVISKEPLGPVVRSDDVAWFNIVKWVGFALVNAEELGIGTGSISEALASTKPDARRFTGAEGDFGKRLGLDNSWAIRAVRAVGHYGEMFERNVGSRSKLAVPRGLNQLWSQGGILYAPPMR